MAKGDVKGRSAEKEVVDLSSLEGLSSAPQEAPKGHKKVARPTLTLTGDPVKAKKFDVRQAAKIVMAWAEVRVKSLDEEVKTWGRKFFCEKGVALGCCPVNPQIATEKSSATYVEMAKWKIHAAEGVTVKDALKAAGLTEAVATAIASKVSVKTSTTIAPLQELNANEETKPLFQKVFEFIQKLPAEERAVLIRNVREFIVAPEFLDTTFATIATVKGTVDQKVEMVGRVMAVVSPQQTLTSNKFDGDLAQAIDTIHAAAEEELAADTVKKTTTTTKVEVVAAGK